MNFLFHILVKMIKTIIPLLLSISFGLVDAQDHPVLLPQPQSIKYGTDIIKLSDLSIYQPPKVDPEDKFNSEELARFLKERTGISIPVSNKTKGKQILIVHSKLNPLPGLSEVSGPQSREAYTIKIDRNGIVIQGNSSAAAYYAIQTLRQMPEGSGEESYFPEAEINDYPVLPYRGLLVAFGEGAIYNEQFARDIIDELARFKSNQFMFYSESSIELDSFPLLGYKSKVSKETIRRLIKYARERHVDIIPFQALYGHLHDIFRIEKYSSLSTVPYGFEFDPTNPQARDMVRKMVNEISDLFPSPFFHIGFDETWFTRRLSRMQADGVAPLKDGKVIDANQYFLQQLNFVAGLLREKGKTGMAWLDIFINESLMDQFKNVPKDFYYPAWYYNTDTIQMNKWIDIMNKNNLKYFVQPSIDNWNDFYSTQMTYDNADLFLPLGKRKGALGMTQCLWTDAMVTLTRPSLVQIAYTAAGAWQKNNPDKKQFVQQYGFQHYDDPFYRTNMVLALNKIQESNDYLAGVFPSASQNQAWVDPFREYFLEIVRDNRESLQKSRISSEEALEALIRLENRYPDDPLVQSLNVISRMIDYTAMRALFAEYIHNRWTSPSELGKYQGFFLYYDLAGHCHSKATDLIDFFSELKNDYEKAYLNEYTRFKLGAAMARFDHEIQFWQKIQIKGMESTRLKLDPEKPLPDFYMIFDLKKDY
jgi:hexosaminidase